MQREAFFGGSFDPPHGGHLAVARAASRALALDKVHFAPVGVQPLKGPGRASSFADRVEMTRLAISAEPGFALSLADAPRADGEPNFTYETLLGLRATMPAESALYCLMGADSFRMLRRWRQAERIPLLAPLIVASRPGESLADLRAALPEGLELVEDEPAESSPAGVPLCVWTLRNAAGEQAPLYLLPGLDVEISATQIRAQAGAQGAVGAQLPPSVDAYIRKHGLYGC